MLSLLSQVSNMGPNPTAKAKSLNKHRVAGKASLAEDAASPGRAPPAKESKSPAKEASPVKEEQPLAGSLSEQSSVEDGLSAAERRERRRKDMTNMVTCWKRPTATPDQKLCLELYQGLGNRFPEHMETYRVWCL